MATPNRTPSCFPSSSRAREHPPSSSLSAANEAYHPPMGLLPPRESNTLAVPLALANILWCPPSVRRGCAHDSHHHLRTHQCGKRHHHGPVCALGPAVEEEDALKGARAPLVRIGTAFAQCLHELRFFVQWNAEYGCLDINAYMVDIVDKRLRDCGFYEDSQGTVQTSLLPKDATPTTPLDKDKEKPTARKAPAKSAGRSKRSREKQREQINCESVLADCARYVSIEAADKAQRKAMAPSATLAQALRALNSAVLRFGLRHSDSLIYTEVAALVALLNYAAAFYHMLADDVETYMQCRLDATLVEDLFHSLCSPRWTTVEAEENRARPRTHEEREKRKEQIEDSMARFVPDTLELRDGVQLVLFTFVWINYTAFAGAESAMSAMLHTLVPLLQTVVVRCARQAYLLQRMLIATDVVDALTSDQLPCSVEVQWDLLDLADMLHNFSGGQMALFTSFYRLQQPEQPRQPRQSKRRKAKAGCWESVVRSPRCASIYTAVAISVTLDLFALLVPILAQGKLTDTPRFDQERAACRHGHKPVSSEDRMRYIMVGISQRLVRLERTQPDWMALLKPKPRRRKKPDARKDAEMLAAIRATLLKRLAGYIPGDPLVSATAVAETPPEGASVAASVKPVASGADAGFAAPSQASAEVISKMTEEIVAKFGAGQKGARVFGPEPPPVSTMPAMPPLPPLEAQEYEALLSAVALSISTLFPSVAPPPVSEIRRLLPVQGFTNHDLWRLACKFIPPAPKR